jgi:ABC-type Fe3+/spermidine/putrescine transport system ATPase subunit
MSERIRAEHVTKRFGSVTAVDDVSFATEPGEMFFLLGPSGCGKTTLLRAVAGLGDVDAGEFYIGERCITDVPPHRRNTAMVFQNYALWPHMTVLENVTFGLSLRGIGRRERKRQGMSALEIVQMPDLADRKPNQLSGGQQQRVALARALAIEPDCLLLDEPLSNLDAKLRLEMRSELRRIHRETRLTILYVTHDQKEALSLADRVALMRDGRIEQLGTPRELYHRPASRFAAAFLGETNFLRGTYRGLRGTGAAVEFADGILECRTPEGNAPGEGTACELSVRPEALTLHGTDAGRPANSFAGVIREVTFLGELEQMVVSVEGQGDVRVVGVPGSGPIWSPRDKVTLAFAPEAATVFAGHGSQDAREAAK